MAGDWIKLRIGLADDPAVVSIARATKLDVDAVVGKLHRIWGWADQNTADGRLNGIDAAFVDEKARKKGFAQAMSAIQPPWILIDDSGITIPNFERHNGTSAKSRAENTERQRRSRGGRDEMRDQSESEKRFFTSSNGGGWDEARQKASELAEKLGTCSKEIDRRLMLGACYFAVNSEFNPKWLDIALQETRGAHAKNPYAYFQKVLVNLSNDEGFNLKGSLARLDIPEELLTRKPRR